MIIQWMINWLFDEKFVLFGGFLSMSMILVLVPIVGNDCAKKNKKAKNKNKKPKDSSESEPSKKGKNKKKAKDEESGDDEDDDEEKSKPEPSKVKSAPIKKKAPKKKGKFMNSRMPKQSKGSAYNPPPQAQRPQHPGFEAPVEPTEDTNTYRQIEGFRDAQNF